MRCDLTAHIHQQHYLDKSYLFSLQGVQNLLVRSDAIWIRLFDRYDIHKSYNYIAVLDIYYVYKIYNSYIYY